jgi:hypothetical protein
MENFFNWMSKPIPANEVEVWFQVHNIIPEKIVLYGDIFVSLSKIILETYLGEETFETKIIRTDEDIKNHYDWCWRKMTNDFELENLKIEWQGEHKDYLRTFFDESFYRQESSDMRKAIPNFIVELFDIEKPFAKSDLDILTEIYKLLDRHVKHL